MAAYMIARVDVIDSVRYEEYRAAVTRVVELYGGWWLVRGGAFDTLEGAHDPRRLVVIGFSSVDQLKRWWRSPEYRAVKALREGAAQVEAVAVEGV